MNNNGNVEHNYNPKMKKKMRKKIIYIRTEENTDRVRLNENPLFSSISIFHWKRMIACLLQSPILSG